MIRIFTFGDKLEAKFTLTLVKSAKLEQPQSGGTPRQPSTSSHLNARHFVVSGVQATPKPLTFTFKSPPKTPIPA